ncbi:MAG: hypothetical protein Q8P18_05715 [Pseudomonadota bacterium]|nr:hypothetical protein [Pseudomonadota bacterium]
MSYIPLDEAVTEDDYEGFEFPDREPEVEVAVLAPSPRHLALETAPGPIATWVEVARAIGVDDSTIRAHRRRTRDGSRPFFADATAARSWYSALVRTPTWVEPARGRRRKASSSPAGEGPVDWSKVTV